MLTPVWLQRVVDTTLHYEKRWGSASLPNYMLALHLTGKGDTTPDAVAVRMGWAYTTARRHLERALSKGLVTARMERGAKLYQLTAAEAVWIANALHALDG